MNKFDDEYDYLIKTVVIGDSGVGKSSILLRYVDNTFVITHLSTIGVDFKIATIIKDHTKYKFQLWDTAGQDRFRTIVSSYYRGAHCFIVTFDLTSRESFDNLDYWMTEIDRYSTIKCIRILVGTKSDLKQNRVIAMSEIKDKCSKYDVQYVETSSKTGDGINGIFEEIISQSETIELTRPRTMYQGDNHVLTMELIQRPGVRDLLKHKNNNQCC